MSILDYLTPADLELPDSFAKFRSVQGELAEFLLYGPGGAHYTGSSEMMLKRRFMMAGAPAGCGKSLASHTIGVLSGMKYAVLTATLALEQDQVDKGFPAAHIRGKRNYTCTDEEFYDPRHPYRVINCEEGSEMGCRYSGKAQCAHGLAQDNVRRARGIISNYSCWMHTRSYSMNGWEGRDIDTPTFCEEHGWNNPADKWLKRKIELLICDESDLCFNQLASFLSTWLSNEEFGKYANKEFRERLIATRGEEWGRVDQPWLDLLDITLLSVQVEMAKEEANYKTIAETYRESESYRKLTKTAKSLERVLSLGNDNNWIWSIKRGGVHFQCVWPGRYAERYLWSGVPNVILLSASNRPKTAQVLRINNREYHFREWPSQFPLANNPIWWIPTGRMGRKAGPAELAKSIERADELYDAWAPGHKGIVHTHSYKRAEEWQAKSKWAKHMILNESGESEKKAKEFRDSPPPALLVGPSYTTGWDFVGQTCEWIHIPKLPFPDQSDPVVIARMQDDETYYAAETMRTLFQATKRGTRNETDKCTVAITDDAVGNFRNYAKPYAPRYFRIDKWEGKGMPRLVV